MKKLSISISLTLNYSSLLSSSELEQKYQSVYRHIATFFYQHPYNQISIFFPGPLLLWLEEVHPEFTKLLAKMVARSQIEILGGGFYEPLLPTIFPLDRSGQLEFLTTEIRRIFGKRPRGAVFYKSVWENSLVPTLQNGGMEYVLFDSSVATNISEKNIFLPHILNEKGKFVKAILQSNKFTPKNDIEPAEFIQNLLAESFADDLNGNLFENVEEDVFFATENAGNIVSLNIDENQFESLISSCWLEKFYFLSRNEFSDKINITLPLDYLNECEEFVPLYIASGLSSKYEVSTIFDYLYSHSRSRALYNRMLHISMLLSQCKGDKARKNSARENLWIAQSGESYLYNLNDDESVFNNSKIRQYAYRNLTESEKLIRDSSDFSESATTYDYNGDGHNEYIFSMERFNAVISPSSSQIFEFNVLKNSGNYTDNESGRGFFLSYLFTESNFQDYRNPNSIDSAINFGVFNKKFFDEVVFNANRKDLKLLGMGTFVDSDSNGNFRRIPVSIVKKYVANSNGFMVQFILKNESQINLNGILVVESNFAQMDFSSPNCNSYEVEVIHGSEYSSEKTTVLGKNRTDDCEKSVSLSNVSFMQVNDTFNNISFVYEPNENCDIILMPNSSKRGTTFIASLCWKVDLVGGLEMEKTVNFSVITPKKKKK